MLGGIKIQWITESCKKNSKNNQTLLQWLLLRPYITIFFANSLSIHVWNVSKCNESSLTKKNWKIKTHNLCQKTYQNLMSKVYQKIAEFQLANCVIKKSQKQSNLAMAMTAITDEQDIKIQVF